MGQRLNTILIILSVLLLGYIALRNENLYDMDEALLDRDEKIEELRLENKMMMQENAELRIERAAKDELEHELKIFYDSSYIDTNTPNAVKDSVVSDFLRQYDMLVGQRLREGS